jgi:MFS family permease
MQSNLSEVEQRVKRYWYTDGIVEIIGGGLSILIGTYTILQGLLAEGTIWHTLLAGCYILLMVGGVFMTRWLVTSLKTRITYPRTGYVDYPSSKQTSWRRLLTVVIAVGVSALLVSFGRVVGTFSWVPAFTGVLFGFVLLLVMARKSGPDRFYVLAILSILLGLILSFSGLNLSYSLGLFYAFVGMAYAVSGAIALGHYLHENPLPAEEHNG